MGIGSTAWSVSYGSICAKVYLSDLYVFYLIVDQGRNPGFRFGVPKIGTGLSYKYQVIQNFRQIPFTMNRFEKNRISIIRFAAISYNLHESGRSSRSDRSFPFSYLPGFRSGNEEADNRVFFWIYTNPASVSWIGWWNAVPDTLETISPRIAIEKRRRKWGQQR